MAKHSRSTTGKDRFVHILSISTFMFAMIWGYYFLFPSMAVFLNNQAYDKLFLLRHALLGQKKTYPYIVHVDFDEATYLDSRIDNYSYRTYTELN